MLKLMKYEYRRNLTGILVMLSAILGAECYFLWANWRGNVDHVIAASMSLFVVSLLCVAGMLIFSVALYSMELNSKSSYLTFMTPRSSTNILGAKLLAALLLGVFFAALLILLAVWDFSLVERKFPELGLGRMFVDQFLSQMGALGLGEIFRIIATVIVEFLIGFFTTVVVAYLAITVGATLLQNKRFKGILSFLIFIAITLLINWCTSWAKGGRVYTDSKNVVDWISFYAIYGVAMLGSFGLSAWLLEKKVSL